MTPVFSHHRIFARFGRLLASEPQMTAHLLALTASHFSKRGAMLGLEFWVRFRRPIYADETISLEWLVIVSMARSSICAAAFARKMVKQPSARRAAFSLVHNTDAERKLMPNESQGQHD
jgi:hypothetical protein